MYVWERENPANPRALEECKKLPIELDQNIEYTTRELVELARLAEKRLDLKEPQYQKLARFVWKWEGAG